MVRWDWFDRAWKKTEQIFFPNGYPALLLIISLSSITAHRFPQNRSLLVEIIKV